jgi:hypothetical protein
MYEPKTKPTEVRVEDFLNSISDETQRGDAKTVCRIMEDVTGLKPKMWGSSIVGFGSYHYKYASGHEGDAALIGFSPRKGTLTLYINNRFEQYTDLLDKLGNHKTSVACLYIKRLTEVNQDVLKQLIRQSFKAMAEKYPN